MAQDSVKKKKKKRVKILNSSSKALRYIFFTQKTSLYPLLKLMARSQRRFPWEAGHSQSEAIGKQVTIFPGR